jgi:hypothetical protein
VAEQHFCAVEVAPVRARPEDAAEQVTQALLGEPLTVVERRGEWARVRTAYDYPGWTVAAALAPDADGLVHMAWRRLGCLVPRDADQQQAAGVSVSEPVYGDLAVYGVEKTTHIAFWLGGGPILHAAGGRGVVEEDEPAPLQAIRTGFVRLHPGRNYLI